MPMLTNATEKAFAQTPPEKIEIKAIPQQHLLITQQTETYFAANNSLFGKLFRYIKTHNIPMTTPVKAEINPGKMGFYINKKNHFRAFPTTATIQLVVEPAYTVLSMGKRGGYSEKNFQETRQELVQHLESHPEWHSTGEAYAVYWDGPYIPNFAKRFEVHIPIQPAP
ncbi:MAG: hypothetical protein CMF29_00495 [Kiritimatiellaceae bacterium]|nr:hypothetical protein [Kiritimatiellaceae bacterium]